MTDQLSLFEPEMSVAERDAIIRDFLNRYSSSTDTATPQPQRVECPHPWVIEDDPGEHRCCWCGREKG